jgi:hypothetical protein
MSLIVLQEVPPMPEGKDGGSVPKPPGEGGKERGKGWEGRGGGERRASRFLH